MQHQLCAASHSIISIFNNIVGYWRFSWYGAGLFQAPHWWKWLILSPDGASVTSCHQPVFCCIFIFLLQLREVERILKCTVKYLNRKQPFSVLEREYSFWQCFSVVMDPLNVNLPNCVLNVLKFPCYEVCLNAPNSVLSKFKTVTNIRNYDYMWGVLIFQSIAKLPFPFAYHFIWKASSIVKLFKTNCCYYSASAGPCQAQISGCIAFLLSAADEGYLQSTTEAFFLGPHPPIAVFTAWLDLEIMLIIAYNR